MTAEAATSALCLIDTSVLARAHVPAVLQIIGALAADNLAATCVTIDLEVGFSARNAHSLAAAAASRRLLYRNLEITEAIAERARQVQWRMSVLGQHRAAGVIDQLTAAVAAHYGATVLHYDSDFEHIAAVTGQAHLWVAPRGSLD